MTFLAGNLQVICTCLSRQSKYSPPELGGWGGAEREPDRAKHQNCSKTKVPINKEGSGCEMSVGCCTTKNKLFALIDSTPPLNQRNKSICGRTTVNGHRTTDTTLPA